MSSSNIFSNGIPQIPVHTPLPLFEIDRVAKNIPMDNRVGPPVEIDALLAHRRGGQDERPKRTVKLITRGFKASTPELTATEKATVEAAA
nr:hypothetical protein [Arthrobacter sp. OV608]